MGWSEMSARAEWLLLSAQRQRKCRPPSAGHQRDMTLGRTQGVTGTAPTSVMLVPIMEMLPSHPARLRMTYLFPVPTFHTAKREEGGPESESVSFSVVSNSFVTPWTVVRQAPLSMGILQARTLKWIAIPFSKMGEILLSAHSIWPLTSSFSAGYLKQGIDKSHIIPLKCFPKLHAPYMEERKYKPPGDARLQPETIHDMLKISLRFHVCIKLHTIPVFMIVKKWFVELLTIQQPELSETWSYSTLSFGRRGHVVLELRVCTQEPDCLEASPASTSGRLDDLGQVPLCLSSLIYIMGIIAMPTSWLVEKIKS